MSREAVTEPSRESIHRLYWLVFRPHLRSAVLVAIAAIAAGALEALGLAELLPILGRADQPRSGLYAAFAVLGALLVGSVVVRAVADVRLARLNVSIETRLRRSFLDELVDTRWSALRNARSGDLVTALMSESSQVANGATSYLGAVAAFSIAVCLTVTALAVAPFMSVVAMAFAVVSFTAYRRAGAMSRANQHAFAAAASDMNEEAVGLLGSLKTLLATGDRTKWLTRMVLRLEHLMVVRRRDLVIPVITRAGVEAAGAAFLVSAMAITVVAGGKPSAALVTLALFYRVVPRLQTAQSAFLIARTQSVWWERWQERERDWLANSDRDRHAVREHFRPPLLRIELQDVSVSYPGRAAAALDGVTVGLAPGEMLAVVGRTGSGKSTLIDVLTGLITPNAGACLVNGRSLLELDLDSWQRHVGFVPQEVPIIYGTLLDNIVWLEDSADAERARRMIEVAALDDLVSELEAGLDSIVGPRGASVSGGQRQRLAIARALYREPSLLVLDEATSGLDAATERAVLTNLIQHCANIALVIITHRLDTVSLADDVIVLEQGRLVGQGLDSAATAAAIERITAASQAELEK